MVWELGLRNTLKYCCYIKRAEITYSFSILLSNIGCEEGIRQTMSHREETKKVQAVREVTSAFQISFKYFHDPQYAVLGI